MAEYYAVLRKAVAGLGPNSGVAEARRVVYDKARNALIGQLKAVDPPLTTAEISRQRLELEEAIRRVERESTAAASPAPQQAHHAQPRGDVLPPRATARVEPPPPAEPEPAEAGPSPQEVFRRAIQDAEHRGTAAGTAYARSAPTPRSEPRPPSGGDREYRTHDRADRVPPPPPPEEDDYRAPEPEAADYGRAEQRRQPGPEPRLAPEYDQEWEAVPPPQAPEQTKYEQQRERPRPKSAIRTRSFSDDENAEPYDRERPARRRSRSGLIVLLLSLLVIGGAAAVAWSQRAVITDLLASFDGGSPAPAEAPPPAPETEATEPAEPSSAKGSDRLLPGEPPPARAVRTIEPADSPPAPAADGTEMIPGETDTAAVDSGEEAAAAPAAPDNSAGDDVLVAQKAILYEEPIGGATGATSVTAIDAAVTWRFVPNGTNGAEIEGTLQVPERSMKVKFAIRKNSDTTLPASHLVEVVIDTPADFPGRGIRSVPRIVMKPTEEARGQPLVGASAKVADGFFWVALSAAEADVASNIELLRDRDWIDLPFIYDTGQRAILTFEKGTPGEQVFEQAIEAWGGAPSAAATPG